MQVSDTKKNRGAHGVSSFKLGGLPSSSENPPGFSRGECQKFPKWIPVTERLPEPNAVDEYGFAKGYLVKTDRHVMMHTARYTGEWWIFWGKAEVITDTVTHWMSLPEPPKEEC